MAWPQELEALRAVRRKCRLEYWLAGLLLLAGLGAAAFAFLTFVTAPLPWLGPWRLPMALVAALGGSLVLWRRQPGDEEIARRLDRDLGSQERIQTLVEHREQSGAILEMLRRET